jgi:hypothetical protein
MPKCKVHDIFYQDECVLCESKHQGMSPTTKLMIWGGAIFVLMLAMFIWAYVYFGS